MVSKEQFVKDLCKLMWERKQRKYDIKLAADKIREHGIRSVSHGRCKGWGS
jgi:hypothetical protein